MIDQEKVRQLFNDRAKLYGQIPTLNVALFQEKHGDLAQKRDEIERSVVMDILNRYDMREWNVLDAGCGTGRWSFFLAPLVKQMIAFDISQELINICLELDKDNHIPWYVASLDDFSSQIFCLGATIHLVIISGVCLFTNDNEWMDIIGEIRTVTDSGSLIVVREACGSHGRYEIENQWSEELQVEYSAIYRDPDWFRGAFGTFCKVLHDESLLPPELEKWQETHQHLFVFEVI